MIRIGLLLGFGLLVISLPLIERPTLKYTFKQSMKETLCSRVAHLQDEEASGFNLGGSMGLGLFVTVLVMLVRWVAYPYLLYFLYLTSKTVMMRIKHQTNPASQVVQQAANLKKRVIGCVVVVGVLSLWGLRFSSAVEEDFNNVLCQGMRMPPLDYSAKPEYSITYNGVHNAAIAGRSAFKAFKAQVDSLEEFFNQSALVAASQGMLANTAEYQAITEIQKLIPTLKVQSMWMASYLLHVRELMYAVNTKLSIWLDKIHSHYDFSGLAGFLAAPGWLLSIELVAVTLIVLYVVWYCKKNYKDEDVLLKMIVFFIGLGVFWFCVNSVLMEVIYVGGVVGCRYAPEELQGMRPHPWVSGDDPDLKFEDSHGLDRMVKAMTSNDSNLINQDPKVFKNYLNFEQQSEVISKYDQIPLPHDFRDLYATFTQKLNNVTKAISKIDQARTGLEKVSLRSFGQAYTRLQSSVCASGAGSWNDKLNHGMVCGIGLWAALYLVRELGRLLIRPNNQPQISPSSTEMREQSEHS